MTIRAQMPDGTVLEFPDGTSDAVVDRVAKQHIASTKQAQPAPVAAQPRPAPATAPAPRAAPAPQPAPQPAVVDNGGNWFTSAIKRGAGRTLSGLSELVSDVPAIVSQSLSSPAFRTINPFASAATSFAVRQVAPAYKEASAPVVQAGRQRGEQIVQAAGPRQTQAVTDIATPTSLRQVPRYLGQVGASAAETVSESALPILAAAGTGVVTRSPQAAMIVSGATSAPMTYGSIRDTQRETGTAAGGEARAAVATVASTLLDSMFGSSKFASTLTQQAAPMGVRAIVREAAKQAGEESITEMAQTAIERTGGGKDLVSRDAMKDYIESGVVGAFGGGAISGGVNTARAAPSAIRAVPGALRSGLQQSADLINRIALPTRGTPEDPLPQDAVQVDPLGEAIVTPDPAQPTGPLAGQPGAPRVAVPSPAATGAPMPVAPQVLPIDDNVLPYLAATAQNNTPGSMAELQAEAQRIAAAEGASSVTSVHFGTALNNMIDRGAGLNPPPPMQSPMPAAPVQAAPAQAEPVEPAQPIQPRAVGSETMSVTVPATGKKVNTQFQLVDAADLKYAEGQNQNRDRTRVSTNSQIQSIIGNFDPTQLGVDAYTDRGAPIIGKDGTILSGNGRVMVLNQIYDNYPELAAKYREFIESQGFDTTGIDRPVLTRGLMDDLSPEELRSLVVGSNKDNKQAMSAPEIALQDAADILTPTLMAKFNGGSITKAANSEFVRGFMEGLSESERAAMRDSTGNLSTQGVERIENAIMARAYGGGNENAQAFLRRALEQTDDDAKTLTGALTEAAPAWLRMREAIAAGEVLPQYDITDNLMDAIAQIRAIKARGLTVADWLRTDDMFNAVDPLTRDILLAVHNDKITRFQSKPKIAAMLERYSALAAEQRAGEDMFGMATDPASPQELLRSITREADNQAQLVGLEDRAGPTPAKRGREAAMFDMVEEVGAEAPAQPRQPAAAEEASLEDRSGISAPNKGRYQDTVQKASYTNRRSVYDSAIAGTGLTKEQFELLKPEVQARKLITAMQDRFTIKVSVSSDLQLRYAIDQILDGYQAMIGMAERLGIDEVAIGLNGRLGLRLQKKGNFAGLFTTDGGAYTITLPKRSNSFAHELAHAIDYYMLEVIGASIENGGITGLIRKGEAALIPADLREAWVNMVKALFSDKADVASKIALLEKQIAASKSAKRKAQLQGQLDRLVAGASMSRDTRSQYYKSALALENKGQYWTKPTEMFARAFEAYVSFKMELAGYGTEFAGKGDANYLSDAEKQFRLAYPKSDDRLRIFEAISDVMSLLNDYAVLGPKRIEDLSQVRAGIDAGENPTGTDEALNQSRRAARSWASKLFSSDMDAVDAFFHNRKVDKEKMALRAKERLKWYQKINNLRSYLFDANSDSIRIIAKRWNSAAALEIHDQFGFDLGGNRAVGRVWHRSVDMREALALNPLADVLQASRFVTSKGPWETVRQLTLEEERELKKLIYGTHPNVDAADADLKKIAVAVRKLQDDLWYEYNEAAGRKELGYVKDIGYLNDRYDIPLILDRQPEFEEAVYQSYLHVFDRDMGIDAESIAADEEKLQAFIDEAANFKIDGVKALRAAVRNGDDIDLAALDQMRETLRDKWSRVNAHAHTQATISGRNFNSNAPTSGEGFKFERVFTPESRELLKDFYISNPLVAVVDYARSISRRIEWMKRVGPESEKLDDWKARMTAEGVPQSEQDLIFHYIDRLTGRYERKGFLANPTVLNVLGFLKMKGAITMLPRAVIVSGPEVAVEGIVSGKPLSGGERLGQSWGAIFGSEKGKERLRWARTHGLIRHHLLDSFIMHDKYGHSDGAPTRWDRIVGEMMRKSMLPYITRHQQATVAYVGGHQLLYDLAEDVLSGTPAEAKEAANRLSEYGVSDVKAFSEEMMKVGFDRPDEAKIATAWGYEYITAIERYTRMIVNEPTLADRPAAANNPLASYASHSITAFMVGSYRHHMRRTINLTVNRVLEGATGMALTGLMSIVASWLFYTVYMFMFTATRNELFNRDRAEEWRKKGTWWENNWKLAAAYSTPIGWADPLYNQATGLKYQRPWYSMIFGAYMGKDLQDIGDLAAKPLFNNSDLTKTTERNAAKGFYNSFISPAAAMLATAAPGGAFLGPAAGALTAAATSNTAADAFATSLYGTKEEAKKQDKEKAREQRAKKKREEKD